MSLSNSLSPLIAGSTRDLRPFNSLFRPSSSRDVPKTRTSREKKPIFSRNLTNFRTPREVTRPDSPLKTHLRPLKPHRGPFHPSSRALSPLIAGLTRDLKCRKIRFLKRFLSFLSSRNLFPPTFTTRPDKGVSPTDYEKDLARHNRPSRRRTLVSG